MSNELRHHLSCLKADAYSYADAVKNLHTEYAMDLRTAYETLAAHPEWSIEAENARQWTNAFYDELTQLALQVDSGVTQTEDGFEVDLTSEEYN